jgi:3-phenylpropionate/cinnamic acid dioxygenase small subunit
MSEGAFDTGTPVDPALEPDVQAFLYREARLADEARYSEWESLWDDDGLYWVPMGPDHDPRTHLSYIYDNRKRIRSRVAQLNSGVRHSQTPPSVMRRLLTNVEVLDRGSDERGSTVTIGSNFVLFEYRYGMTTWAGRVVHTVRRRPDGSLALAAKTVHLVNAGGPVPTLAFLI